ncbi:hypothetical protein MBLNU457_7306t3 [Dothideomycetes sp. NU457]
MTGHAHAHVRRSGYDHVQLHDKMMNFAQKNVVNNKDATNADVATVFSVVYVTMSASFTGPVAGYVTMTGNSQNPANTKTIEADSKISQGSPSKATSAAANTPSAATSAQIKSTQPSQAPSSATNTAASSKQQQQNNVVSSSSQSRTTLATSTSATNTAGRVAGTPISATRAEVSATTIPTASASATSAPDSGMTGGAKAGVAFGILLVFALVAGAAIFFIRKKKQQKEQSHQKLEDEKTSRPPRQSMPAAVPAPRLSLRPVTQFMGIGGDNKVAEMTNATGGLNVKNSAWERRPSTSDSNNSVNPFGDSAAAEKAAEQNALNAPIPVPMPAADPFADKQSQRSISPISLHNEPQAPPAARVAPAPQGNAPKGANNVHRVHLDFKPSMEDELELRAGDVVRILHEYDDGWTLCMRMDRSKQGVAPRQCLSKMPIKPRPAGPPPNGRPQSPAMRNGPPNSRPQSPAMRNGPSSDSRQYQIPRSQMQPAPLSPSMPTLNGAQRNLPSQRQRAHSLSQSNGPAPNSQSGPQRPQNNHRRSASAGTFQKAPSTASLASIPTRKPVPGHAM